MARGPDTVVLGPSASLPLALRLYARQDRQLNTVKGALTELSIDAHARLSAQAAANLAGECIDWLSLQGLLAENERTELAKCCTAYRLGVLNSTAPGPPA